jgi:peptide/nickel transport system ATP-binding protein
VEHVASEVMVMYLGRMVERNQTADLFKTPRHPYTQALLASVLTPEPGLGLPDVGLGDIMPDPAHLPTGCRFHPRCLKALPQCATQEPPLRKPTDHAVLECHLT